MKLTEAQQQAVDARGAIIVTAAAGSGKTAVLVERVIEKLCYAAQPIDADRLLIVTFTKAAAAEMKQRIVKRLSEEQQKHPDNMHILRQQLLIESADICTIDSFCIKLVRNYFNILTISPDFKIADTAVCEAVQTSVISSIFEEKFTAGEAGFHTFLKATNCIYGDENAMNMVLRLYHYSQSLPFPEFWLRRISDSYSSAHFSDSVWANEAFSKLCQRLPQMATAMRDCTETMRRDVATCEKCLPLCKQLLAALEGALAAAEERDWDGVHALSINPVPKFPTLRAKAYDPDVLAMTRACYSNTREAFYSLLSPFALPLAEIKSQMDSLEPVMRELCDLCIAFGQAYLEEMKSRAYLTFAQTEQLALQLLCGIDESGEQKPTDISAQICDDYDEIMVDEYQDVNDLQNTLFEILSAGGKRLFTVGDTKQSIYGFRGANPNNFIRRSRSAVPYADTVTPEQLKRIVLSNNFRSRFDICAFINGFFSMVMTEDYAGMAYDENEMLYALADFPENGQCAIELQLLSPDSGVSAAEAEAERLADFIEREMKKPPFLRGEDEKLRTAEYSDFAVLFRKSNSIYACVQALRNRKIPVAVGNQDYFQTAEIEYIMALLSAVDNPMDDISMLAVMLSPMFGFTPDELACMRADFDKAKPKHIYAQVVENAKNGSEKCNEFMHRLADYRTKAACTSMRAFVGYVLDKSGLRDIASAMSEPKRRQNNLLLFEDFAEGFETEQNGDLSGFLRFMRYMAQNNGCKSVGDNQINGVRLMTMHMSKGLQFPICVLASCFSSFSNKDSVAELAFDETLGAAINLVDNEENKKVRTFSKELMNTVILHRQKQEELRLLYVAMTRAEEKLVFLLCDAHLDSKLKKAADALQKQPTLNGHMPISLLTAAKSYADWILPYMLTLPAAANLRAEYDVSVDSGSVVPKVRTDAVAIAQTTITGITKSPEPKQLTADGVPDMALQQALLERFSYRYPYEALRSIEAKTSVSKLTKREAGQAFCATARPAFLSARGLTPEQRGTALHQFMQFADFHMAAKNVPDEIARLCAAEYLSDAQAAAIDPGQVEAFFQTDLFHRLLSAETCLREQRFLLDIPAAQIDPTLPPELQTQTVIVQGAVDCMFFEPDGIVLLDFKTDRAADANTLLQHYSGQLQMYCLAVERMYGKPVKECCIYSLMLGQIIPVSRGEQV